MKSKPTKAAMRLLHEGALAFARMEHVGMKVDVELLKQRITSADAQLASMLEDLVEDEVWQAWKRKYGVRANLHSNPQLADVIYNVMGVNCGQRTASGLYSTDEKSLLATGLPFCVKLIERKKLEKIAATYLRGIEKFLSPDGRLRPSFNLHTAVSYRSGCRDPNSQNFPKRNKELAKLVRECFIPSTGCRFVEGDFSILEVRTMACSNKDPKLIEYIVDPSTDMHRDVAAELFLFDVEFLKANKNWAKETVRNWAKNRFVFPQFYGDVWFSCAPLLWEVVPSAKLPDGSPLTEHLKRKGIHCCCACKVTKGESKKGKKPKDLHEDPKPNTFCHHVKEVERSFWQDRFKVYSEWKKQWYKEYQEKGYVRSFTGFVYEWGGEEGGGTQLPSRNDVLNHFNQGQASHCGIQVIVWLTDWLLEKGMEARIVGFIHDSILVDCPKNEVQLVIEYMHYLMTEKLLEYWDWIIVPMAVEFDVSEVGGNWYEMKTWEKEDGTWRPK